MKNKTSDTVRWDNIGGSWVAKIDFTLTDTEVPDLFFDTPVLQPGPYQLMVHFAITGTPESWGGVVPSIVSILQFDTEDSVDRVETCFPMSTMDFAALTPGLTGNPPTPFGCHVRGFWLTQTGPANLAVQWENQPQGCPDKGESASGFVRVLIKPMA